MALILVLIGFYLDYKYEGDSFFNDLKGGLFICTAFVISALTLKTIFGFHILTIVFSIGIEIILLFSIKAYFNSKS